jgi:L-aspartate oxidase
VAAVDPDGRPVEVAARHVVLASGGAGQLFGVTTNPALSTGDGVAMALRAGAAVADVEFVQFHPTALAHPGMPRPLLSEALRGEGALLRDDRGVAFMAADHPLGDLAPRDVVARSITRRLVDRGLEHLWLDATAITDFAVRFPTIYRACRAVGLDPTREWLPVAPAAHYLCGGVVTDLDGAASLPGLWGCGEVACTGVHGANRLASNSLLEGLVFGARVASAIAAGRTGPEPTGALRGVPLDAPATRRSSPRHDRGEERQMGDFIDRRSAERGVRRQERQLGDFIDRRSPERGVRRQERQLEPAGLRSRLQSVMTANVGVLRDAAGLQQAGRELSAIEAEADGVSAAGLDAAGLRALHEVRNLATVGRAVAAAAAERQESRGAHHRLDHPKPAREVERIVHVGAADRIRVPASLVRELER